MASVRCQKIPQNRHQKYCTFVKRGPAVREFDIKGSDMLKTLLCDLEHQPIMNAQSSHLASCTEKALLALSVRTQRLKACMQ